MRRLQRSTQHSTALDILICALLERNTIRKKWKSMLGQMRIKGQVSDLLLSYYR